MIETSSFTWRRRWRGCKERRWTDIIANGRKFTIFARYVFVHLLGNAVWRPEIEKNNARLNKRKSRRKHSNKVRELAESRRFSRKNEEVESLKLQKNRQKLKATALFSSFSFSFLSLSEKFE